MDFMNLNQSAHGDREFAYIVSRLRHPRKIVVAGHWQDEGVQARIGTWARAAAGAHEAQAPEDRAVRRQHARGRRHRGRQGRGPGALRVRGQRLRHRRAGCAASPTSTTPTAERLCAEYDATYEMAPELRRGGERRDALIDAARIELGPARVPRGRWLRCLHRHVRGPRRPASASRHRGPAPHGRRLRLRRRGRLEDRRARAHREGHDRRPRRAGRRSWRTTRTTSGSASPLVLGAHMLEVCPSISAGHAALRDPPAVDRRP